VNFLEKVRKASGELGKRIVLPETSDQRVLAAAAEMLAGRVAKPVLLGRRDELVAAAAKAGLDIKDAEFVEIASSPLLAPFTDHIFERRRHKGATREEAAELVRQPLMFGACMVALGKADGAVGGSASPTADLIRAAIFAIGPAEGLKTVSSFMAVDLPTNEFGWDGTLFYADIGTVIAPSTEQLADIAIATADTFKALTGQEPRVAMLSFSTKGSAKHSSQEKVAQATEQAQKRRPDLAIDGEMQVDAALIPAIASKKGITSPVGGRANVFVFPDLNSGNIAYKITERIAHARVCGPVLQGLSRPMSDLSRGCKPSDIADAAAVVSLQAQAVKG